MGSDIVKAIKQKMEAKEGEELRKWKRKAEAPLPLALALKMYELYLNGFSCEEIWRVNGQKYPLGQIVDAKLRYEWDDRKAEQLDSLYGSIEEKVLHVKNDAVSHLAGLLAAAHKIWGDRVAQFLQEGDQTLLAGFDPSAIKTYKEILSMLQMLVANKDTKEVKVSGNVEHVHTQGIDAKKMTGKSASDLLRIIESAEYSDTKK
jgi:hypothetical protein